MRPGKLPCPNLLGIGRMQAEFAEQAGPGYSPTYGRRAMKRGTLHSRAGGSLKRRTVAAALAREHLALVGAKLLEQTDVLVIDISRTRAAFTRAKSTAILAVATKLFPGHKPVVLKPLRTIILTCGRLNRCPAAGGEFQQSRKLTLYSRSACQSSRRAHGLRLGSRTQSDRPDGTDTGRDFAPVHRTGAEP